jgi:hypothetical protein
MNGNSTALTIEKTGQLIQSLLDVQIKTQIGLPQEIQSLLNNVIEAQTKLVKEVDNFLHRWEDPDEADINEDTSLDSTTSKISNAEEHGDDDFPTGVKEKYDIAKFDTVKAIIEACPEFLATKNEKGLLPIHCAAIDLSSSRSKFVPLLATVGYKFGIGGEEGRGGLLVEFDNENNVLTYLVRNDNDTNTLKKLLNSDPPMLRREDVSNYNLIHRSLLNNFNIAKFIVELNPQGLYQYNHYGDMPIHYICKFHFKEDYDSNQYFIHDEDEKTKTFAIEMVQLFLENAILHDPRNVSIGCLFAKGNDGALALSCLIRTLGKERVFNLIEKSLSRFLCHDLPILHQIIRNVPQYYFDVLNMFPDSIFIHDQQNRLPINIALEEGMQWSNELVSLIHASYNSLSDIDPITKLPLFALSAAEPRCDLRTIYYLLRKYPLALK